MPHTFSMGFKMTSWAYSTAEMATTTWTQLTGDPGTSLLSDYAYMEGVDSYFLKLGVQFV